MTTSSSTKTLRVLGFMTGTSLDAVDMAVIETDGETIISFGPAGEMKLDAETRAIYPFDFVLESTFVLEKNTVRHTLTVQNPGKVPLRFGLGFHPGFRCPFDDKTPLAGLNCCLTSRRARRHCTITPQAKHR